MPGFEIIRNCAGHHKTGIMFGNKMGNTDILQLYICHKVDSTFLFAITATAVVPCSDHKKSLDTSSIVQIMFILAL